jgi:hypothetical protein
VSEESKFDLAWAIDSALHNHAKRMRRERIATAVMTGYSTSSDWESYQVTACAAVRQADALIAELDKEPT